MASTYKVGSAMMELQLGTVSDYAYADQAGKLFILGEFRYIFADEVPVIHQRMVLTFRVVGDRVEGLEHELKLDLTDADGNSIIPSPIQGPLRFSDFGPAEVGKIKAQAVVELVGVKFPAWGDYAFQIFVNRRHLGAVRLTLIKRRTQRTRRKKKGSSGR